MLKTVKCLLFSAALLTQACTNRVDTLEPSSSLPPALPAFNAALFSSSPKPIAIDKITRLNEDQQRDFYSYFNDPVNQSTAPNLRAFNYLSLIIDRLRYSDETLTAEETLEKQSGNCLSLTNLTRAIADLAGVEIAFHLLESNPIFSLHGEFLTKTDHLRSVLKGRPTDTIDTDSVFLYSVRRDLRIDYFDTSNLRYIDGMNKEMQTSLYFSNLAVDFLLEADFNRAFSHAAKALEISPQNSSALNLVGILHRRLGDYKTAEEIYLFGAKNLRDKTTFVRNHTTLLEVQDRNDEAKLVAQDLIIFNKTDPWHWIRSGLIEHKKGHFKRAIEHYNRALTIAPDLDQVHWYTAQAHRAIGSTYLSKVHLKNAIEHSQRQSIRSKYESKLRSLEKS